jgi:hypothetical protein
MPEQNTDPELQAIQDVIEALESLDPDARTRVLAYVFQRLDLSLPNVTNRAPPIAAPISPSAGGETPTPGSTITDIRTLKAAKQPKSDNQMAALVAYYLRELAPTADRKQAISHEDIEKYFKQAGYPLPKRIIMTLNNAKSAGYFDSAGSGLFNLNPVGHNLVVHGMPSSSADRKPPRKQVKKTALKKKTK